MGSWFYLLSKPICLKWLFQVKQDFDGQIIKHKANLVLKGFSQSYSIDFTDVFALVLSLETVRVLLAISTYHGWKIHDMNLKSTFLNGEIIKDIYVYQPEGYETTAKEHLVYKLKRAL